MQLSPAYDHQLFNFGLVQILMRVFATCAIIQLNLVDCHLLFSFDRGTIVEKNLVSPGLYNRLLFKGLASLYDSVGVPSNGDKTFEYTAPVGNEHQWSGHEIGARVNRVFYEDVDTNANKSEDISSEGQ